MTIARACLLVQLGTLPLVGLIWFVQIVAYRLFERVGVAEFPAYHAAHARLITFVVAPLMLGELAAALAGVAYPDRSLPREVAWLGAARESLRACGREAHERTRKDRALGARTRGGDRSRASARGDHRVFCNLQ